MRKIKEIIRLKSKTLLSNRQISQSIGVSASTVTRYLHLINKSNIPIESLADLTDSEIEAKLFKKSLTKEPLKNIMPDYEYVHTELKKKGVTKQLLWEEYKQSQKANSYSYSHFCMHYRNWCKLKKLSMRQNHKAGEKMFVGYAGQTKDIYNPITGETRKAQIFIAVLGASNYTYVEASASQTLPDWLQAHVNAFNYYGGVPEIIVPDNLKSGVSKACRYEPDLNPSYLQLAEHYGVAIIPARARKPKDKAKVENAVLVVERWILAAIRNKKYYSLYDLNSDIKKLLEILNKKEFKKITGSREQLFLELEQKALNKLPGSDYVYTEIKKAKVHVDYHIEFKKHYYSVPYKFVGKQIEVHFTGVLVGIFYKGEKICSHKYSEKKGFHTTVFDHMPENHKRYRAYGEWTQEKFHSWALKIGENTLKVVKQILQQRKHVEQNFRSCFGLLGLAKKYSNTILEAVCKKAVCLGTYSRKSIASILDKGLEQEGMETKEKPENLINHENIRGSEYYR